MQHIASPRVCLKFSWRVLLFCLCIFAFLLLSLRITVSVNETDIVDIDTYNGRPNVASSCDGFLTRYLNDKTLIDVYKRCVDANPGSDFDVGPELFNRIFISDIFGNVNCEDIQKHFIKGQDLVALASVQGSFNTWSRILMEQMTGE